MDTKSSKFFKVITQSQTYLSIFYLLFSSVLGIFYFIFLVIGISLGLGLMITLLGAPILFGTLLLWRVFAGFERQLIKNMLSIDISFVPIEQPQGTWKKVQTYLSDSFTWKSLAYLFIKFPLGIISFVVLVTLLSVSLGLIATPMLYHLNEIGILQGTFCIITSGTNNFCLTDSYFTTIIAGAIGIFLLFVFLHALNGLARISGLLAKSMLEN